MRLLVDSLIALMLVGILSGILLYHRQETQELHKFQEVHAALARLHEQALYHGALGIEESTPTGFPRTVSPLWFDGDVPMNSLVSGRNGWIDIAPLGDMSEHPPDPVCLRDSQAGFWYNPNRGIFRARVPEDISQTQTLTEYNRVNGTYLKQLPLHYESDRRPEPLQLATMSQAAVVTPGSDVDAEHSDEMPGGKPARQLMMDR